MASESYEKRKVRVAKRDAIESKEGREIGPLLKDRNLKRKDAARFSLRLFCETFLPERFHIEWSQDHLKVIEKLEAAILNGGLFALAMPRASGKTTLCEAAALWAILYGHRRFVVLIGATDDAAKEMMDSIKIAVETNDLLFDSFHAACQPIRQLEGINNRNNGQTVNGSRTRIVWSADEAVFPTVDGAPSSGARIRVAGITGRIRGMKAATADGKTIRPDFAIADDPQTDTSAVSPLDCDKRERRLRGAVKGLAGPGRTIAMVVPCTVIAPGDLSDRILDRQRNEQFQGERMRMVYSFPTNTVLWAKYEEIRRASLRADRKGEEATEFYRENRAAMDDGAVVAWDDRYDRATELSAVQAAMNLRIDNPSEFYAEYQNDPQPEPTDKPTRSIDPAKLIDRLSRTARYVVPRSCTRLTAFIDCGKGLLWYAVVAWDERFNGTVIDYGTYPKQSNPDFRKTDPRPSIAELHPKLSDDQAVYAALTTLAPSILGRDYLRQDTGEPAAVERCLIDSGWSEDVVLLYTRKDAGRWRAITLPSRGYGEKVGRSTMNAWPQRDGERVGNNFRVGLADSKKGRICKINVDHWKGFLYDRLTTPPGGSGHLDFFGDNPVEHAGIFRHCAAERGISVIAEGREFEKWEAKPNMDNDWWDCLVGNCVAASVQGLKWSAAVGEPSPPRPKKPKRDYLAEFQAQAAKSGMPTWG